MSVYDDVQNEKEECLEIYAVTIKISMTEYHH